MIKFSRWRTTLAAFVLSVSSPWVLAQASSTAGGTLSPGDVVVSGPAGQITRADVEMQVQELVPPAERAAFWLSPDAVARFARGLYTQRVLAAEAEKAGVDKTARGVAFMRFARERALAELLMQQRVQAATPDAAALERFAQSEYKAMPERFNLPEEVRVRHILLPVARDGSDDAAVKAEAEALIEQVRKGADFATLAQERSADKGSAQRGGDLGFFPRGKMAPEFEAAAFALNKKGELSAPVKSRFGYHVIEFEERRAPLARPFDKVLPEIREEALNKINKEERRQAWEAAEAGAKVDQDVAKSLAISNFKQP